MPENLSPFLRNFITGATRPLILLGKFQAGDTQAIKRGEILELSSTNFIPLSADKAMSGIIAIADEEVKAGDRAGYYRIIVPRPGDVFEFALAAAGAHAVGAAVYFSDSQTVKDSGTNRIGAVVSQDHYPQRQGHLSDDGSGDMGTTIRATKFVGITIDAAASWYSTLQG